MRSSQDTAGTGTNQSTSGYQGCCLKWYKLQTTVLCSQSTAFPCLHAHAHGIGKYQTELEIGGQSEPICTGQLPEENTTQARRQPIHSHQLDLKIKKILPGIKGQKRERPLPVRSEGTRYFLLSRSGTLALGAFSTMT